MENPLLALLVLAFGVLLVTASALVLYGWPLRSSWLEHRRSVIVYHQLRTNMFIGGWRIWPMMLPFGVATAGIGLGALLEDLGMPHALTGIVYAVGLIAFPIAIATFIWPMRWALPHWYVDEWDRHKQRRPSGLAVPPEGPVPVVSRRALIVTTMVVAAGSALYLVLGGPLQYLLLGLGACFSVLGAARIRR